MAFSQSRLSLSLSVQYASATADAARLPPRSLLRRWATAAQERDAVITLRFVGANEGRRLNRAFRRIDRATNVLTFVYDDDRDGLRGDIVLCVPVLRQESATDSKSMAAHTAHLFIHGMLHLQGYDHERSRDAERMERREVGILATLGFSNPYLIP